MTSYLKPAILTLGAIGFALCAATYGRTIASSPADHAAPLAAPFLLCAGASLATFAAAGAAAGDAASRRQR
jgi:hypothetical protein